MEDIYKLFLDHPSWGKILSAILLPILGWGIGKLYDRFNGDNIFSNKRIVYRIVGCAVLGILTISLEHYIIAWIFFCILILPSTFIPLPHEYIILKYGKKDKPSIWLQTTPALLRFYWEKIISTPDVIERQDAKIEFIDEIRKKKWELFDYEYRKYYLSVLKVYLDIGAISLLKRELDKLNRFDEDRIYIQLQMLYHDISCDYKETEDALSKLKDVTEKENKDFSVTTHIDEMAIAEKLGETEREAKAVKQLESDYKKVGVSIPVLCSNLMQYYDRIGEKDKADKLAKDIENTNPKSFNQYLEIRDVAFMHYRRTNNYGRLYTMLDEIWAENEKRQKGEKKMLTQVRLMPVYLNNQGRWMEYSTVVFSHHNDYLSQSWRVGVELIKNTLQICRDANNVFHLQLFGKNADELFNDFNKHVDEYIKAIESEIADTRDEMVYRYKGLLMDKLELITYKYGNKDIYKLTEDKNAIYERILKRCNKYENIREYIHFLTVYIDDILTCHKQIEDHKHHPDDPFYEKSYDKYEKSWEVYKNKAVELVAKMDVLLSGKEYDRSLAYYILYDSYFHYLMNDYTKSLYYFNKFRSTGVSIKNFTLAIQQLYNELKIKVADEPVRWETPDGRFGYINIKFPSTE